MRLNVLINETLGVDRTREPMLGGIPLARGALRQGGWFALEREDGRAFAAEGAPAAFWPDGSVKWLHLWGMVDLAGGGTNRFVLREEPGSADDRTLAAEAGPDGAVSIRGGELDVDVRPAADHLLSVACGDGTAQLRGPGISASLELCGPEGDARRACAWSPGGDAASVVVDGASRKTIRVGGGFRDAEGNLVAELIFFIEIWRDAPEIRLQPVFIYLGQPRSDLVSRLSITAHTGITGDAGAYAFGNERGRGYADVVNRIESGPRWPQARQVQLGSSFYRTEKRTGPDSSWVKAVEGRRAPGWCRLGAGEDGPAVTGAMRYFWQEYPHSLAVDTDAGTLTFGLVPAEAGPLDLRRYSPTVYGRPVYETGSGPAQDLHGATGIAKAHELCLRFHAAGEDDAPERGLFFANPCRPLTEPGQVAESLVLGRLPPPDGSPVPEQEADMTRIADFLVRERDVRGWYGLMDYGDLLMGFYTDRDSWAFDDGGYAWVNTERLPDYGLWMSALRAARADWLQAAIAMTRHNRDVDIYHRGELKGLGTRHNVNHWGCADKEFRVSMPISQRLHYYTTADPWSAEVIRDTLDVYRGVCRSSKPFPSVAALLMGMLTRWEMSGSEADRQVVNNMADAFAKAVLADGQFTAELHMDAATGVGKVMTDTPRRASFLYCFGGQHTLVEVAELLEHEPLADAIVRHVDHLLDSEEFGAPDRHHMYHLFFAYAWRRTGNRRCLDILRRQAEVERFPLVEIGGDGILDTPRHLLVPDMERRNKCVCRLGERLHLMPYALAALAEAGK